MRRVCGLGLVLALVLSMSSVASAQAELVRVVWDRQGVPHVYADTNEGVAFGLGYATAVDRSTQIELFRRAGTGTVAELVPTVGIGPDISARRDFGSQENLQAELARLPQGLQAMFRAYAEGVNSGWRSIGYTTNRPWEATDSLSIGFLLTRPRNSGGANALARLAVREILQSRHGELEGAWRAMDAFKPAGPDATPTIQDPGEDLGRRDLYQVPVYPPGYPAAEADVDEPLDAEGHPATATYSEDPAGPLASLEKHGARLPDPFEILEVARELLEVQDFWTSLLGSGSQQWSVSPERSATAHPVLYDAPSLGINSAPTLYQAHMKGGNYDTAGVAVPGTPGIVMGRNRHGAWGSTDAHAMQEDVFVEVLCSDHGTAANYGYLHDGQCKPMEQRVEQFGPPHNRQNRTLYYTVHGPVVSVHPGDGVAFSFHRLPDEVLGFAGWEELMRAEDAEDFRSATRPMRQSTHLTWADRDGNIAYELTGGQPLRPEGWDGQYPAPGTGEWDRLGILDGNEIPGMRNPSRGYLANANNRAAPGWRFHFNPANFGGPGGHIDVIHAILEANDNITVEEQVGITREYEEARHLARRAVPLFLEAVDKSGTTDPDALLGADVLREWNGKTHCRPPEAPRDPRGGYTCPGNELLTRSWNPVQSQIMQRHFQGLVSDVTPAKIALLALEGRTSVDYLDGDDVHQVLAEALATGVRNTRSAFGSSDPADWSGQGLARVVAWCPTISCPSAISGVPGGVPIGLLSGVESGSNNTYRQVVVLDETISDARWIIMPGNSEDPGPHLRDNLERYRDLELNPMWFEDEDVLLNAERVAVVPYGSVSPL